MPYPYSFSLTRAFKSSMAPVGGAEVTVHDGLTGALKPIYPDAIGAPGTAITQPVLTDEEGNLSFFVRAGRIRIDVRLDASTTRSIEDIVVDADSVMLPVMAEVPSGDPTGTTFTLERTPRAGLVALYVGGIRWEPVGAGQIPMGQQFAIEGNTITTGVPPGGTVTRLVDYIPL